MAIKVEYDLIPWEDAPSTATPINAENLNARDRLLKKVVDKTNELSGQKADKTAIPIKTSQLQNDSNFLTQHQDISGKADKATTLLGYGITDGATKNDLEKISDKLDEFLGIAEEPDKEITIERATDGYYNSSGSFVTASGYKCARTNLIPTKEGEQFSYSGMALYGNPSVIWYSNETTKISQEAYNLSKGNNAFGAVTVTAPVNAKFARFFSFNSGKDAVLEVQYLPKLKPLPITITDTSDKYILTNGSWTTESGITYSRTNYLPTEEGEQFNYRGFSKWSIAGVCWFDESGGLISNDQYSDGSNPITVVVTAPVGAKYVMFGSVSYTTPNLSVSRITKESEEEAILISNVLYRKKYVACGDSFTEGDFTNYTDSNGKSGKSSDAYDSELGMYKTYPWHIAKRNGMILVNEAKCGSDFTNISGATNAFSVSRYTAVPTDADYITLMFGLNETSIGSNSAQIGTNTDATNTTLWGAYNIVFEYFLTNMPYAKIGVIISDAWMPENYANAVKEICDYWGIPYLDLKGDKSVPMMIGGRHTATSSKARSLRNNAFQVSSEDSHPNVKAHEYRSTVIENFLRSL